MVNEEMGEQKLYQFLSVPIATTPVLVSVIHRSQRSLAVVAGMKKPNDHAEQTKVERNLKKKESKALIYIHKYFIPYNIKTKKSIIFYFDYC